MIVFCTSPLKIIRDNLSGPTVRHSDCEEFNIAHKIKLYQLDFRSFNHHCNHKEDIRELNEGIKKGDVTCLNNVVTSSNLMFTPTNCLGFKSKRRKITCNDFFIKKIDGKNVLLLNLGDQYAYFSVDARETTTLWTGNGEFLAIFSLEGNQANQEKQREFDDEYMHTRKKILDSKKLEHTLQKSTSSKRTAGWCAIIALAGSLAAAAAYFKHQRIKSLTKTVKPAKSRIRAEIDLIKEDIESIKEDTKLLKQTSNQQI